MNGNIVPRDWVRFTSGALSEKIYSCKNFIHMFFIKKSHKQKNHSGSKVTILPSHAMRKTYKYSSCDGDTNSFYI